MVCTELHMHWVYPWLDWVASDSLDISWVVKFASRSRVKAQNLFSQQLVENKWAAMLHHWFWVCNNIFKSSSCLSASCVASLERPLEHFDKIPNHEVRSILPFCYLGNNAVSATTTTITRLIAFLVPLWNIVVIFCLFACLSVRFTFRLIFWSLSDCLFIYLFVSCLM